MPAQPPLQPAPPPARAAAAQAAARASLLAADRAHAARSARSLTVGFPTALDRDVVLLYPGAPIVRGRAAAESRLRALPNPRRQTLRWSPALAELSADGLRGYTLGYGTTVAGDSAAPARYLAYWRRTPAGAWHVAAWISVPGSAATPRPLPPPCARPASGAPAAAPNGPAERELRTADSLFADRAARDGAGPAFAATVAPDGLALAGTPAMTCGPAAISALLAGLGPGALTWAPVLADAAPAGDLGMTVGTATVRTGTVRTGTASGGADVAYSKYLTIWRRVPGGAWRLAADAGNAAPSR